MTTNAIPNELSSTFLDVISSIRTKVNYDSSKDSFSSKDDNSSLDYDYVETLLTDELAETDLHYDKIGEEEFQRIFEFGINALTDSNDDIEEAQEANKTKIKASAQEEEQEEEYEEEEYEEEDAEEEHDNESPLDVHFSFISEIIEEVRANPETDEEYIEVRIKNGLKTRGIEVSFN